MNIDVSHARLGQFIVDFQQVEAEVENIVLLLAGGNELAIKMLLARMEYGALLTAADSLFAYAADSTNGIKPDRVKQFHKLMDDLHRLGQRRNQLVHSTYMPLRSIDGEVGLWRENMTVDRNKGKYKNEEDTLMPAALLSETKKIRELLHRIEEFRIELISWRCQ
jgi:hypothetical protein